MEWKDKTRAALFETFLPLFYSLPFFLCLLSLFSLSICLLSFPFSHLSELSQSSCDLMVSNWPTQTNAFWQWQYYPLGDWKRTNFVSDRPNSRQQKECFFGTTEEQWEAEKGRRKMLGRENEEMEKDESTQAIQKCSWEIWAEIFSFLAQNLRETRKKGKKFWFRNLRSKWKWH